MLFEAQLSMHAWSLKPMIKPLVLIGVLVNSLFFSILGIRFTSLAVSEPPQSESNFSKRNHNLNAPNTVTMLQPLLNWNKFWPLKQ
eukprot:2449747-Amphidinium_carterae.1